MVFFELDFQRAGCITKINSSVILCKLANGLGGKIALVDLSDYFVLNAMDVVKVKEIVIGKILAVDKGII